MDYYTEGQINRIINRQTGTKYIGLKEWQKAIQLDWIGQMDRQTSKWSHILSYYHLPSFDLLWL